MKDSLASLAAIALFCAAIVSTMLHRVLTAQAAPKDPETRTLTCGQDVDCVYVKRKVVRP